MPRPICEAHCSIDIRKLNREGGLRPGRCFGYTWTRLGEPFGEVRMVVERDILFLLAKLPNDKGLGTQVRRTGRAGCMVTVPLGRSKAMVPMPRHFL